MDLNSIIPKKYKHLDNWVVKSRNLMFRKYENIPVCFISNDDVIYIYLDLKIKKQIIEITKELMKSGYKFYFTIPEASNPAGVIDYEDKVIRNYLLLYANEYFYTNFNNIHFDLIKNMVDWAVENDCYDLIKENFDSVLKQVQKKEHDYYSNTSSYNYSEEIRNEFLTLYRQIQINQIID